MLSSNTISTARGKVTLHSRNWISTAATFWMAKINTAMINNRLKMDFMLCMSNYPVASIPEISVAIPGNDCKAAMPVTAMRVIDDGSAASTLGGR